MEKNIKIILLGLTFPIWGLPMLLWITGKMTYEAFEDGII